MKYAELAEEDMQLNARYVSSVHNNVITIT